jgi:DNA-binding winged helix-turn-helix (wHTH) protein
MTARSVLRPDHYRSRPTARSIAVFLDVPSSAGAVDARELFGLADALHDLARELIPGASAHTEVRLAEPLVPEPADGDIVIDLAQRHVVAGGRNVALTRLEFDLLVHLALSERRVVGREELMATVWSGRAEAAGDRTIDIHVARLRRKLDPHGLVLTTVRGVGFRLESPVTLRNAEGRPRRPAGDVPHGAYGS